MIAATLLLAMQVPAVIDGEWRIRSQTDPLDDTVSTYLLIGTQADYLAVGCERYPSGRFTIIFKSSRYLGESARGLLAGGRDFTYRFDNQPRVAGVWEYARDRAIEDRPRAVAEFLSHLRQSTQLYVRATSATGENIDVRFRYRTPEHIVPVIEEACSDR